MANNNRNNGVNENGKNKKYYWIQLKAEDFDSLSMKKLRRQQNGYEMLYIYQRMLLMSAPGNGEITFQSIGIDIQEEIAETLDVSEEVVRQLFDHLIKYHLLELDESTGDIFVKDFERYVGGECDSAARTRAWREKKKLQASHCDGVVTSSDDCVTQRREYIETDKDLETETEKDLNTHIYIDARADAQVSVCENPVILDDETSEYQAEFDAVVSLYPKRDKRIQAFDAYCKARKGRTVNGRLTSLTCEQIKSAITEYIKVKTEAKVEERYWDNLPKLIDVEMYNYISTDDDSNQNDRQSINVVEPEPEPEPEPPQTIDMLNGNEWWNEADEKTKQAFIDICNGYVLNTDINCAFNNFWFLVDNGHWLVDGEPFNFTPEEMSKLLKIYKEHRLQNYGTDTYYWDDLQELLTKNFLDGFLNGMLGKTVVDLDEQPKHSERQTDDIPLDLPEYLPF